VERGMSGWILGQRLIAHGVKFEHTPERAHSQNHGHERDTFLVDGDYSTLVVARYDNVTYQEVGIDSSDSCAKLARKKIYVLSDGDFTGYRRGLWLTSKEPDNATVHKLLFVMEPAPSRGKHSKKNEA
jgi:hypothetical protein